MSTNQAGLQKLFELQVPLDAAMIPLQAARADVQSERDWVYMGDDFFAASEFLSNAEDRLKVEKAKVAPLQAQYDAELLELYKGVPLKCNMQELSQKVLSVKTISDKLHSVCTTPEKWMLTFVSAHVALKTKKSSLGGLWHSAAVDTESVKTMLCTFSKMYVPKINTIIDVTSHEVLADPSQKLKDLMSLYCSGYTCAQYRKCPARSRDLDVSRQEAEGGFNEMVLRKVTELIFSDQSIISAQEASDLLKLYTVKEDLPKLLVLTNQEVDKRMSEEPYRLVVKNFLCCLFKVLAF
jgi:hypothetical protein